MKICDPQGDWFQSSSKYRFTDPSTGAVFEPGVPTKAKMSPWIASQSAVIKPIPDPLAKPPVTANLDVPKKSQAPKK